VYGRPALGAVARDAAHRVHTRIEDAIRTDKDAGLGHSPFDFQVNAAWLTAAMTGQILLAWLKLLALAATWPRPNPRRRATGCCTPRPGWPAAAGNGT
jgi:hypothetical protein